MFQKRRKKTRDVPHRSEVQVSALCQAVRVSAIVQLHTRKCTLTLTRTRIHTRSRSFMTILFLPLFIYLIFSSKQTTYMSHVRIKHPSRCVCELCGYAFINQKGVDVHKFKKHKLDKNVSELCWSLHRYDYLQPSYMCSPTFGLRDCRSPIINNM